MRFHGSNHISVESIKSGNTARGLQNLAKPDCSQLDAVLAAVKAWPGNRGVCGATARRPALTAASVPIPIVRKHLRHTLGERSESKGHWQLLWLECPL